MSANHKITLIRRPGTTRLLLLSLIPFFGAHYGSAQAPPAKPAPDVIVFSNGDQLSGTFERAVGDSYVFKSDIVGEVTVSGDKIKELRTNGAFVVLKKGEVVTRTAKVGGPVTVENSAITTMIPAATSPEVLQVKDVEDVIDTATYNKEVMGNPGVFAGWNGAISGGATVIQSTQYGETFTAAVNLVRQIPTVSFLPPRTRSTVNVLEAYGKLTQPTVPQTDPPTPDAVAKTSIFHADAEHDKYFSPKVYALVDSAFDHNFAQGLNFQQIYGVGVGATLIQTPKQQLDVKADIHYERQNFQPPTVSEDLVGSIFAEQYHRNLPAKLVFTESGSFIPAWNDWNAYSAIGAAGLVFPVYHRLGLNVNVQDNFINNPAFGYKKNSFQFVTGITYTLR
jgi:Protein of unknown function, DUF481